MEKILFLKNMIYLIKENGYALFQNIVCASIGSRVENIKIIPFINCEIERKIKSLLERKRQPYSILSIHEVLYMIDGKVDKENIIVRNNRFEGDDWKKVYLYLENYYPNSLKNYIFQGFDGKTDTEVWIYALLSGKKVLLNNCKDIESMMIFLNPDITLDKLKMIQNKIRAKFGDEFSKGYFYCPKKEETIFLIIKYLTYVFIGDQSEQKHLIYNVITGNNDYGEEIIKVLEKDYGYLHILGHSNGIDMGCGKMVLCGKKNKNYTLETKEFRYPPCVYNNICNRNGAKVFPDKIHADIIFLYTCWGILFKDSLYSQDIALSTAFILSINNGVYISTYGKSNLDDSAGEVVANYLSQGLSIGKAIHLFNLQHYLTYNDTQEILMVLGDPDFKVKLPYVSTTENKNNLQISKNNIRDNIIFLTFMDFIASVCSEKCRDSICMQKFKIISRYSYYLIKYITLWARYVDEEVLKDRLFDINERKYYVLVSRYQKAWIEAYLSLNYCQGGVIQLNYEKYLKRFSNKKIDKICPCCGTKLNKEVTYYNKFQTKRTTEECQQCGYLFEGFGRITHGEINCDVILKKENNTIQIKVEFDCFVDAPEQGYSYMICLEPFIKKSQDKKDAIQGNGKIIGKKNSLNIVIENFSIKEETNFGAHYLNAIIVIGYEVSFIRRLIYTKPEGE